MSNGANGSRHGGGMPHLNGNGVNGNGAVIDCDGSSANGTTNKHLNGAQNHGRMDRKTSSPMMPAFMVSAPGKVIVFGEHAVVHGKVRYPACTYTRLALR